MPLSRERRPVSSLIETRASRYSFADEITHLGVSHGVIHRDLASLRERVITAIDKVDALDLTASSTTALMGDVGHLQRDVRDLRTDLESVRFALNESFELSRDANERIDFLVEDLYESDDSA